MEDRRGLDDQNRDTSRDNLGASRHGVHGHFGEDAGARILELVKGGKQQEKRTEPGNSSPEQHDWDPLAGSYGSGGPTEEITDGLRKLFSKKVKFALSSGWLEIRLSGHMLKDRQIAALARYLDELLPDSQPEPEDGGADGELVWANVDLDRNSFGDMGLVALLDVLVRHRVRFRCVKLYKNAISDVGGLRLADALLRQSSVEEVHLSHNAFTARTLVAMCLAIGHSGAYPSLTRSGLRVPCWLRLEHNHIERPLEVLELLRTEAQVWTCLAKCREKCGVSRCVQATKSGIGTPSVHLFTIGKQIINHDHWSEDDRPIHVLVRDEIRRWREQRQGGFGEAPRAAPELPGRRESSSPRERAADERHAGHGAGADRGRDEERRLERDDGEARLAVMEPRGDGAAGEGPTPSHLDGQALRVEAEPADPEHHKEQRRLRLSRGQEIVASCSTVGDSGVHDRWLHHLEGAEDPEGEALRVLQLVRGLSRQGYNDRPSMACREAPSPSFRHAEDPRDESTSLLGLLKNLSADEADARAPAPHPQEAAEHADVSARPKKGKNKIGGRPPSPGGHGLALAE